MMPSIGKKLALLLALGLLGLGALGYVLYRGSPLHAVPSDNHASDFNLLKTIGSIRTEIKDIETAELRYVLTGEQEFLSASGDASVMLRRNMADLKAALPAAERSVAAELASLIEQRILVIEQIVAARQDGIEAAGEVIRAGEGRRLTNQIAKILDGLELEGFRTSTAQDRDLERGVKKGFALVAAGYGASILLLVLSFVLIRKELAQSLSMQRTLAEQAERLRVFTEAQRDTAQLLLAPDGRFTAWPPEAERLLGFPEKEMLDKHFSVCFSEEEVKLGKPQLCLDAAAGQGRFEQVCSRQRKDGTIIQALSVFTALRGPEGRLEGYSVVLRDVSEQKRAEDLLRKLSLTVEQAGDLVMIIDRSGRLEYVNKAVEDVTGYSREEFMTRGLDLLQMDEQDAATYRKMWDAAVSGRTFQAEIGCAGKTGERLFLNAVMTPIKDSAGSVTHTILTGNDLTPVKTMRDKLDYLSSYDTLTGLPNRSLFAERLNRELTEGSDKRSLAVLTIDIDRFKYLNEIYGLEAGNKVLKQVAESLSVSVNQGDTVGRLGSDEFGLVLHDVDKPADAVLFVKMIMKNIPQIVSGGEEIAVTLAVGIAVYPADGGDAMTLIKNANTALAKAKDLGRNRYQFYTPDMNEGISELVFMEQRLSEALKNKEYAVAYQPYYHLGTKKIGGAEALLRWTNEQFGPVSPSKFIPMLEETGMIADVGSWVLKTACRQIKDWTNGKGHLPVSVNLSPSQFRHEYLVETVSNTVRELGIDPKRLVLEVTESIFMKDQEYAITVLRRLKGIGVSISIDDFGTGYSSLSYLKKFPVDIIKIDQSFVRDVATDPDTTSLVSAIISMAHSLNLKTIAEGIETEEQWKILRLLKCDMGQGFYFSLAVPPREFELLAGHA